MAEEKKRVTRRRFGKAVAQAGAAAAAPMLVAGAALGQSASPASSAPVRSGPAAGPVVVGNYAMVDRIRVGGIGIGGRIGHLDPRPFCQTVSFFKVPGVFRSSCENLRGFARRFFQ